MRRVDKLRWRVRFLLLWDLTRVGMGMGMAYVWPTWFSIIIAIWAFVWYGSLVPVRMGALAAINMLGPKFADELDANPDKDLVEILNTYVEGMEDGQA